MSQIINKLKEYKLDKIRVTFPDGHVIEDSIAWKTVAETIIRLGIQRVFDLKIMGNIKRNILLVDSKKTEDPVYKDAQKEIAPGFFLHTYNNTKQKVAFIEQISEMLHEDLQVEIIKNHVGVPQKRPIVDVPQTAPSSLMSGQVVKSEGLWRFNTGDKHVATDISTIHFIKQGNVSAIPFTDHWTPDSIIIRHEDKYGVFSLPDLGDFGNDGTLEWINSEPEAFPYDEIKIIGFGAQAYGLLAYRIGKNWGINAAFYAPSDDRVVFSGIVACDYPTIEAATEKLESWRDPFQ